MTGEEYRAVKADVERRVTSHFAANALEQATATAEDWNACVLAIALQMYPTLPTVLEMEEDYARLQAQALSDADSARAAGRQDALETMADTIAAFCTSTSLGYADMVDIGGMRKAEAIIRRELS